MKHLIWITVAVCMLHACTKHTGYTINGTVSDTDGQKVVLKKIVNIDSDPVSMDSCTVKNGKFEMKGNVECPEYCILYIGNNGPLMFFVENSPINIEINSDKIQDSKVTGSKETDLLVEFSTGMKDFETRISKVNDDYMSLKLSGTTDVEKEKGYLSQMDQIRQERVDYMKRFAQEHPNSIFTAVLVDSNLSYYVSGDQMEAYANGFDGANAKSRWVQNIKEKAAVAKRLSEGQPFPDITLSSPDGQSVALSDYAGKGKYVLIDFWASWCRPCRMANPHVVKLYNQYKDKGFEIVGVSLDKTKADWLKAIEDDGLTWPQMSDLKFWQSAAVKLYNVTSIPYTILLDKDGKILAKNLPPDALNAKLAELMK